ncbi:hypothetical protein AB0A81_40300 [Streptomyces flaveolus]|uniref:Uncharacterized protein n=1 Tax=Streptomyces flaveolus TaxID=67297 RepID=A0ABV1VIL4_9ACTN
MFVVSAASVARSHHALPGVRLVGLGVPQHLLAVRDRFGERLVKRPSQRLGHACPSWPHDRGARLIRALYERLDRLDAALTKTV